MMNLCTNMHNMTYDNSKLIQHGDGVDVVPDLFDITNRLIASLLGYVFCSLFQICSITIN